jgi:uncharacterized protein (DUF2249 family)/quercetin dioxygenase-like cupin family protein
MVGTGTQPQAPGRCVGRTRPLGQTSATAEGPSQQLAGTVLRFDLGRELALLTGEERWRQGEHNTKTLVKESSLRVVLVAIKRGVKLPVHQAPVPIILQTLHGSLRVRLPDRTADLPAGSLLVLDGNVEHDVKALEESAFLLTVTWTSSPNAEVSLRRNGDQAPRTLDEREFAPRERHERIFATFVALNPGEPFELINDHDPKLLYYQFEGEQGDAFSWHNVEEGPDVWRVRIGKAS